MAMKCHLNPVGGGKARVRDAEGRELEVDGRPVEVELSGVAPGPDPSEAERLQSEAERLRAENARLRQVAEARARSDAQALAGRRKAMGLDRESLRAVLATTPDGLATLAALDRGELSWDNLIEAPVAGLLDAGR